jgi:Glycosyltransferase family 92
MTFPFPHPACLKTYRHCARWIAFIDIDEFLYAREDDSLLNALRRYEQFPAVAVNWLMFSASGHILKPGGLVIENYTRCQLGGNKHARLIVNPSKTESMSVHEAKFSNGQCAV